MKRLEYDERTGDFNEIEYSLWGIVAKILLFSLLLIVAVGGVYAWFKGWQISDAIPLIKKYCGLAYSKGLVAVKFLQSYLTVKSIAFVGIVVAVCYWRKKIWKIIKITLKLQSRICKMRFLNIKILTIAIRGIITLIPA